MGKILFGLKMLQFSSATECFAHLIQSLKRVMCCCHFCNGSNIKIDMYGSWPMTMYNVRYSYWKTFF